MAEIPVDTLPRLQTWWSTLEAGTQAIFEAIYMDAPGAVSRAVSGGEWEAADGDPGLAMQLGNSVPGAGAGSNPMDSIPIVTAVDQIDVTPFHAGVGQPVTFKWTEQNTSTTAMGAYAVDVYVTGPDGSQVGAVRLDGAGLDPGATAQRSWDFPGGDAAGSYQISMYLNSEGADPGSGVPGPQGYRSYNAATFEVGSTEGQAAQQDDQMWFGALNSFSRASSASVGPDSLVEGVNLLAATDGLTAEEQGLLGTLGERLQNADPERYVGLQELDENLATLSGTAMQAGSLNNEEYRARLFAVLGTLSDQVHELRR